jgi:hypothetical protein
LEFPTSLPGTLTLIPAVYVVKISTYFLYPYEMQ